MSGTITGAWLTATLSSADAACGCPTGCDNCAYRSSTLFNDTDSNYVVLTDESYVFDVRLGDGLTSWVTDGISNLTSCPDDDDLECLSCRTGYNPAYYAGYGFVVESSRPQELHGQGFQCILMDGEVCDPLTDAACSFNFTFTSFGTTFGWLLLLFVVLIAIFQALRAVPLFRYTCDPNFYMMPKHPRYPPNELPREFPPGPFGWLVKAWRATDTEILKHCTPDELMMLRWFRMNYHFFFGASLFCTPALMALYWFESEDATTNGMRRFTIEAAKQPYVFWVAICQMWVISGWAVYLLTRETRAYARLIWKLGPARLGVKSHAVIVNDIPMLTTDPMPNSMRNRKDDIGILSAINSALMHKGERVAAKSAASTPRAGDGDTSNSNSFKNNPGINGTPSSRSIVRALQKGDARSFDGLGGLSGFQESDEDDNEVSKKAVARAKKWMRRNASAVRIFMDHTLDIEDLRACTKTEMVQSTKMKLEAVLGEGCVVSCMPARDVRALDKESKNWHAANERHLQALIQESNAQDDLSEAEADAAREKGGLGRLPTLHFTSGDGDDRDDDSLSSFSFPDTPDAELGGMPSPSVKKESSKRLEDARVTRLRAKRDWAIKERELARDALSAALKKFDTARYEYLNDETPTPSMLVVFSRQMDAVIASQVQVDRNFGSWRTTSAPGPNDLVWHNVALTSEQRARKNLKAKAVAFVVVFFFLVPVNLLKEAATSTLGLDGATGISKAVLALILIIFLVVGHIVSLVLSRQYGHVSISKMDVTGASIYFWLLVLNLFVSQLSSTPVWFDVIGYVQDPKLIVDELFVKVVVTSTFFLQFCMLRCAQSAPLELIHPPFHIGLAVKTLIHLARAGEMPTKKMIQNWTEPENTPLHRVPAQTMMVVFLGMMYCVIAPVTLPICGVMFSLFYLFWKHNLCYHYTQPYASGQTLWPWLVKHTYVCLLISQVILALGLPTLIPSEYRQGWGVKWMRLVMCPIPILTVLQLRRTERTLQESYKVPVHKQIIDAEEERAEAESEGSVNVFDERGVVGDVGKFIKRGLRSPQMGKEGKPEDSFGAGLLGRLGVSPSAGKRAASKSDSQKSDSPTLGDASKKSSYNSQTASHKSARRLNLTAEEARSEVQRLIDLGVWRNYQPISIWPQVSERAAASLIVKRWREKKSVKLRIARRMMDNAMSSGAATTETLGGVERVWSNTQAPGHNREPSF